MNARLRLGPLAVATALIAALVAPQVAVAQATDLTGVWDWTDCSNQTSCYTGPATIQHNVSGATFTWHWDGAGPDSSSDVTGNATISGTSFTLTTDPYGSSTNPNTYTAQFQGQIVDADRLEGTWQQNDGQDGTFTATRTKVAQCGDDIDNDGDANKDYPNDKGCEDPLDDSENSNRRLRVFVTATPPDLVEIDDDVLYEVRLLNAGPQAESVELRIALGKGGFDEATVGTQNKFDGGCRSTTADFDRVVSCTATSLVPGAEASVAVLFKARKVDLRGQLALFFARGSSGVPVSGFDDVKTVHIRTRPPCGATFEMAKVKCGSGTITGTSKDDILVGSDAKDTIKGGGGNDWMFGLLNNDNLDGGGGLDWLIGGPGNDINAGGKGRDHCEGDAGKEESCEDVM